MKRLLSLRFGLLLLLLGAAWAVQLTALRLNGVVRQAPAPMRLGNRPETVSTLTAGDPGREGVFSFVVLGDINTGQTDFEEVYGQMRREPAAFQVLLGDLVPRTGELNRRYFAARLAAMGLERPAFVVAGNHDLDHVKFPVPDFEAEYGPADFSFTYGGCLFVILGRLADPAQTGDSLAFLEKTLREQGAAARWRFVFLHYPPPAGPGYPGDYLKDGAKFVDCLERYHADYVFSGHVHRFMVFRRGVTRYELVGNAGARLRNEDGLGDDGRFHHGVKLTVSSQGVCEFVWQFPPAPWWRAAGREMHAWLARSAGETLRTHRAAAAGVNVGLALVLLVWGWRFGSRPAGSSGGVSS